ncbi:hypothetical protein YC2023_106042 [Brassica napus]
MDEEELEDGMESFDTLSRHSLQLAQRHQMQLKQRKDSDRPLYQGQKTDSVDISLQPEELEANKCIFEYEEAREEERNYAISQRTSVTWSPRCKKYIRYGSCKHDKSQGKYQ